MLQRGQELSSRDEPLAAWNGQQSTRAERFHVIFNGKVYFNTEWVDAGQRPGDINDIESNPWQYERDATKAEMARLGNPTGDALLEDHHHPLKT
ncbi:hypothetical protein [Hyalangium rubrum]|uniref:Uncharacterized protein n=1 Tax=Hyalangium rubrum TaxID=3103134 RepID=A0ABU5HB68_9BACT|nr:hypothetical protein [Hyalangium sp. s54d21]MDY7230535.1 hypothetical protein [Hyalangium sp. s54d21]